MYSLTLEINQRCNLDCKYCYLGEKNGSKMSIDIANLAVDIAFEKTTVHKDKTLSVSFVGGEALLDFDLMKEIVQYIEDINKSYNYKILYSVTTNATIITMDIMRFLSEKDFSIKISIDGNKRVNDLNRIAKGNYSVHDCILKNLPLLKEYERNTNNFIQVTNVITGNNYMEYFHTLKYLTATLDLKVIDTAIDVSYEWGKQEISILEEQIRKSLNYFEECLKNGMVFFWAFADQLIKVKKKCQRFYSCGAGIVSSYIGTDGSIYPCTGCLDEIALLGNVKIGYSSEKINRLKGLESIENDECNACTLYEFCSEKACVMGNISYSGSKNEPVPILCHMRKFMNILYDDNPELMSFCKDLKRQTYEEERKKLKTNE